MKDMNILEKIKEEEILLEIIMKIITLIEVAQIFGFFHFVEKYNRVISNIDLDKAKKRE